MQIKNLGQLELAQVCLKVDRKIHTQVPGRRLSAPIARTFGYFDYQSNNYVIKPLGFINP